MNILSERFVNQKVCAKIIALGLAASTLLTCLLFTGCLEEDEVTSYIDEDGNVIIVDGATSYVSGGSDDPNHPDDTKEPDVTTDPNANPKHFDTFVPNPDFTVDEENITASQVLENLDEMATDFAEMKLYNGSKIDREDFKFWATFTSFAPKTLLYDNDLIYDTFAPLEIQEVPQHSWFYAEEGAYYGKNTEAIDCYYATLLYHFSESYRDSDKRITKIIMPKEEYETMLDAFGVKKHTLTFDEIKDHELYVHWMEYIDTEVYDAFTLDREKIENSTPEQLLAINNLIKAMYNINMIGTTTPIN